MLVAERTQLRCILPLWRLSKALEALRFDLWFNLIVEFLLNNPSDESTDLHHSSRFWLQLESEKSRRFYWIGAS